MAGHLSQNKVIHLLRGMGRKELGQEWEVGSKKGLER